MPQVLTLVPTEGESPEQFAARASAQVQKFFAEPGAKPAEEPVEPDATD